MRLAFAFIISLFISFSLWLDCYLGQAKEGKFTKGKVILRLRYRGFLEKPITIPYRLGLFVLHGEGGPGFPHFVGTDWNGNIYLSDPVEPEWCILQCYDRRGKFLWSWGPIPTVLGVTATKDDYLWIVMIPIPEGIPVIVLKKSGRKPKLIWDWREGIPKKMEERIRKAVEDKGLKWEWEASDWWVGYEPEACSNQVVLRFSGGPVRPIKTLRGSAIARTLWILISSDGYQIFDAKILDPWEEDKDLHLSPDGKFWIVEDDFDYYLKRMNRLWIREKDQQKGKPLIDRTVGKEPWANKLGQIEFPSKVKFDTKHIYLIWERGAKDYQKYPLQRFVVEGRVLDLEGFPAVIGEMALVILDRQKRSMIYHLPWTPVSFETNNTWIEPLPDGSGFYRIEYREREAVIYFHPLPK